MCEPTTLLTVGASLGSQMMKASAQDDMNQAQRTNSVRAYTANHNQSNLQMAQEAQGASQKILENTKKAAEAFATSKTIAGESGIAGLSVDSLLNNLASKEATYNLSVLENNDRKQMAINGQRTNSLNAANSQINSVKLPEMPDYLGSSLKIGKALNNWGSEE